MPIKGAKGIGVRPLGYGLGAAEEATDPEFNQTVLLLHADGSEGAGDTPNLGDPNYKAFRDNSTSNHPITVLGNSYGNDFSPYYYADGYWSNKFVTGGEYIHAGNSTDLNLDVGDFLIEAWVWINKRGATADVTHSVANKFNSSNGAGFLYGMYGNTGILRFYAAGGNIAFNSSTAVPLQEWTHICLERKDGVYTHYINGVADVTTTTANIPNAYDAGNLIIGRYTPYSESFDGYISNVRIVKGHAPRGGAFTPPTTPFTDPSVAGEMSVFFDGSGDGLNAGTSSDFLPIANEDFTFEAWVYLTATPGAQGAQIMGVQEYGTNSDWVFYVGSDLVPDMWIQAANSGAGVTYAGSTAIKLNEWNHIAWSRSGTGSNNMKLFINGVQDAQYTYTGTTVATGTTGLSLGSDGAFDEALLTGYISNARIIKGTGLYTTDFTPPSTPLTAVTNTTFLSCQGKTFQDSSTTNAPITRGGNARVTEFSPFNDGYWSNYFDGSGDELDIANVDTAFGTSNDFTVELWFNASTINSTDRSLIDPRDSTDSSNHTLIWLTTANKLTFYTGGASRITSSTTITANRWYHVALVRNSGTTTLYLDGSSEGTYSDSLDYVTTTSFHVGERYVDYSSNSYNFHGYISNLRVVNGTALYTTTFTPSTSPFTTTSQSATASEVKLLTCQSNRFIDNSGNAGAITVNGNTSIDEFIPFELLSRQTKLITCQGNRFKDIVPARFPITLNGTPEISTNTPFTVTKTANVGSGFFQRTTDYLTSINTATNFGTSDFTMECWVYYTALPSLGSGHAYIYGMNSGSSEVHWYLAYNSGTGNYEYTFRAPVVSSLVRAIITPTAHEWIHLAVVRSGTTITLFQNGQALTPSQTGNAGSHSYTCDETSVGGSSSLNGYFDGYIADVRVINGTALYTSNFTPPTSSLTAVTNTTFLTCQYSGAVRNVGFVDDSKYNRVFTRNGDMTMGTFSPFSLEDGYWSNNFDGSGDYLEIAASSDFEFKGDFTIEAWVYRNDTSRGVVVSQWVSSGSARNRLEFDRTAGKVNFTIGSTNNEYDYTHSANQWFHIAVVRNGSTVTIYENGTSLGSFTNSSTIGTSLPFTIGRLTTSGDELDGYISNLRVVNGMAIYTSAFTSPTTPFTDPSVQGEMAVELDGTNDYLLFPDSDDFHFGSGDFTVEGWVYSKSHIGGDRYIAHWGGSSGQYSWAIAVSNTAGNGTLRMLLSTDGSSVSDTLGTSTYPVGAWRHVALTREGNTFRLFENGVVVATNTSITGSLFNSPTEMSIGAQSNGGRDTNGFISNVRVVKGTALYTSNFTPSTSPLTTTSQGATASEVKLLTCQSTSFVDESDSNRGITVNGDTVITQFSPFNDGYWSNDFSGDAELVQAASSSDFQLGSSEFTIEGWFYPTTTGDSGFYCIVGQQNTTAGWGIWRNGPDGYIQIWLDAGNPKVGGAVALGSGEVNVWNHFVAQRDSSGYISFYLNGTRTGYSVAATHTDSSNILGIGLASTTTGWNASYKFDGYISNIRITKGSALYSGTSITVPTAPYTTTSQGATASEVKLLTCQSNRFVDNSNSAHSLTTTNGPSIDEFIPFELLSRQTKLITCRSNRFIDIIPDRHTLTASGDPEVQPFSPFAPSRSYTKDVVGGSAYLDGTNDYITTPVTGEINALGNDFTVETWFYPTDSTQNYQSMMVTGSSGVYAPWNLYFYGNGVRVNMSSTGSSWDINAGTTTRGTVHINTWNHAAIVREGSNFATMLNGERVESWTSSSSLVTQPQPLALGARADGTLDYKGYLTSSRFVMGEAIYDPTVSRYTIPTAPFTDTSKTTVLLNYNNAGIIDHTMRNNLETEGNTRISGQQVKFGTGSIYFDGTTDKLVIPHTSEFLSLGINGEPFTIEVWAYPTNTMSGSGQIISKGGGTASWSATSGAQYQWTINSSAVTWNFNSGGSSVSVGGGTVTLNTWQHLAVTYDGTTTKTFLNGTQQNTSTSTYTAPTTRNLQYIGMTQSSGYTQAYYGYLDDFRITKGTARYTSSFTAPTKAFANR